MWNKLSRIKKRILIIAGILGGIAGGGKSVDIILNFTQKRINARIDSRVDAKHIEAFKNKTGSLSFKFGEEFDIPREDVAMYLKKKIDNIEKSIAGLQDTVEYAKKEYSSTLDFQKETYQVGLFGFKGNNQIRYRHVNGIEYRVFRNNRGDYEFINTIGERELVK